jgi:uncharacterized protein (TIGR03032 family)
MRAAPREPFDDFVLLISGFGDDGRGGLYAYDGHELEIIDELSTTGLAHRRGHVARLLRAADNLDSTSELLVYDERGVLEYRRIDAVRDPHDITWDGNELLVVSSAQNAVWRLEDDGRLHAIWRPTEVHDSWHPNCLAIVDGEPWVTCFGRFTETRGWSSAAAHGTGFLLNLITGVEYTGLSQPHSPRKIDGEWWVCSSLDQSVVHLDPSTRRPDRVIQLDDYTRGLTWHGDLLYVGESAGRDGAAHRHASLVTVSRTTGQVVERVPVPALEIYDVAFAPRSVLEPLRRGFDTNLQRVAERASRQIWDHVGAPDPRVHQLGLPIDTSACRVEIGTVPIIALHCGETIVRPVSVANVGAAPLASVPPYPVRLSYRWFDEHGTQIDGVRAPLGKLLLPGDTTQVQLPITAPSEPGTYALAITLVQEHIIWFDDLHPDNATRRNIAVSDVHTDDRVAAAQTGPAGALFTQH